MKKFTPFILCVLCVLILLSSCGKAEKYEPMTAYISPGVEGVDNKVNATRQYEFLDIESFAEPLNVSLSTQIMGVNYTSEYDTKQMRGFYTPTYVYKTSAGDQIKTDLFGNVIGFTTAARTSLFIEEADPNNCISAETALAKASEYLVQIFGAETAAKYTGELPDIYSNSIRVRFFRTDPCFNTYSTTDKIIIFVGTDGDFYGYEAYNVGAYDNKTLPADFNDSKIIEIIGESLADNDAAIELDELKRELIFLSDGRLACTTCFRLVENGVSGEWADVMIPLE